MHKNTRNIIFTVFAVIFVVSAPFVVLTTAGYTISFNNYRVQQTGALAISTIPRGATITVNGSLTGEKTPGVIQRTPPGVSTVRLVRRGYLPWEQRVSINAGVTTYIDALLFADSVPELITPLAPESPTPILPPSPPKESILRFTESGTSIAVTTTEKPDTLLALLPQGTYTTRMVSDDVYGVTDTRDTLTLLFPHHTTQPITLQSPAHLIAFLPDLKKIAWSDGLEVNVFDIENMTSTLITRQSDQITALAWHPSGDVLFLGTRTHLDAWSMTTYENRPTTRLFTIDTLETMRLDDAGRTFSFVGTVDGVRGIYKFIILR